MDYNDKNERALREALASARMEGLPVTPEIEENVRRILNGEISIEEQFNKSGGGRLSGKDNIIRAGQ